MQESDAWKARGSLGPLGDKAPHRILRAALHRDWGVPFLQFIPAKLNSGHEMFDAVAPYRHHIYTYVSDVVFQNDDGTLDGDLAKGLLSYLSIIEKNGSNVVFGSKLFIAQPAVVVMQNFASLSITEQKIFS